MLSLLGVGQGQDPPLDNNIFDLVAQFQVKVAVAGGTFVSTTPCLENNLLDFDLTLATTLITMPVATGVFDNLTSEYIISTTNGTYNGTQPIIFEYQWYFNGVLLSGFDTQSFTIASNAYGSYSCQVHAYNQFGDIFSFSNSFSIENAFTFKVSTGQSGVSNQKQFKLPLTNNGVLNITVNWGDGQIDNITSWDDPKTLHTYTTSGIYTIKIFGTLRGWRFGNSGDVFKMSEILSWGTNIFDINTNGTFSGCQFLTANNLDAYSSPIISTTDLTSCFFNCKLFNADLSSWDVSGVTNMSAMFSFAYIFNKDISIWDTSSVTDMSNMFNETFSFDQPIGSWNVSNVTNMSLMFYNTQSFNQDLSSWDVSNVTDMNYMFAYATSFNTQLDAWDIRNVISFSGFMSGKDTLDYDPTYLADIYTEWSLLPVQPNIEIDFGTIQYTIDGQAGKDVLEADPNFWVIYDGGVFVT